MSVTSKGSKVLNYGGILDKSWDKGSYIILFSSFLLGMSEGSWSASYVSAIGSLKWYLLTFAIGIGSMLLALIVTRFTTARWSKERHAKLEIFLDDLIAFSKKRYGIDIQKEEARKLVAGSNHNKFEVLYSRRGLHYPSDERIPLSKKSTATASLVSDGTTIEIRATAVEGKDWRILAANTGRELDRV